MLPDIRSLTLEDLKTQFKGWEAPAYRVGQVLDWVHKRRVNSWEAMTNLPAALRAERRVRRHHKIAGIEERGRAHAVHQLHKRSAF